MKRLLATLALLTGALTARADIPIDLFADVLSNSSGTPLQDGALVVLVASPDLTFGQASSSSSLAQNTFFSGNDVVIGQSSVDSSSSGDAGGVTRTLYFNYSNFSNLTQGTTYYLQLYWFTQSMAGTTALIAGENYGVFRSSARTSEGTGDPWVLPTTDGSSLTLSFATQSASGAPSDAFPDAAGQATLTVIPEPATITLIFGVVVGGYVLYRRRSILSRRALAA